MSRGHISTLCRGCLFVLLIVVCDYMLTSVDNEVKYRCTKINLAFQAYWLRDKLVNLEDTQRRTQKTVIEHQTTSIRLPAASFLDDASKLDFLTNEEMLSDKNVDEYDVKEKKIVFGELKKDAYAGKYDKIYSKGSKYEVKQVKADCLPKLVCELAGLPVQSLGVKERHLLDMIRQSGIGNMAEVASRWHFAVHMGQLLADTQGCAALWSGCPLAHGPLLELARRLTFKR